MKLWMILVFLTLAACTSQPPVYVYVTGTTSSIGSGGSGGGDTTTATGSGGQGGSGGTTTTSTATAGGQGGGGAPPQTGACLGYDGGQLSACLMPLDADACAAYGSDYTYSPGEPCPNGGLVGCCYFALEYTCYYAPTFDASIAGQCDGTWEEP